MIIDLYVGIIQSDTGKTAGIVSADYPGPGYVIFGEFLSAIERSAGLQADLDIEAAGLGMGLYAY